MNTNAEKVRNQQVPLARRGFLSKAGAAALAAVAAVTVAPQETVAVAQPAVRDAGGLVQGPLVDESRMLQDYNVAMLSHMCLTAELMREWFKANRDGIRLTCPEIEGALYDFMFESRAAARVVAEAAGIKLDLAYIAQQAAEYQRNAMGGAA